MSDQLRETKHVTMYPIITLTKGQNAAFAYLFANTKQSQHELFQTIFDAGLAKVFDVMTDVHAEYLAGVAAGEKEGDDGDNRP